MVKHLTAAILASLLPLTSFASVKSPWDVSQIRKDPENGAPDIVVLKNGSRVELGAFQTRYLGRVENGSAPPLLLFEAVPCLECDADSMLYVHSVGSKKSEEVMYPGRVSVEYDILDERQPTPKFETRVFYGDCLTNHPHSTIVFEKSKAESDSWQETARVLSLLPDGKTRFTPVPDFKAALSEATKAAKATQCREVKGTDRVTF